jgi:hypothetical protein
VTEAIRAYVEQMRSGRLSRNRHFDTFTSAEGRLAQRVHRRLRGLERELLAPGADVRLEHAADPDRYIVTVEYRTVRLRRVAVLTPDELALLCQDARIQRRLRAG